MERTKELIDRFMQTDPATYGQSQPSLRLRSLLLWQSQFPKDLQQGWNHRTWTFRLVGVRFMKPEMKPINKHSKMIQRESVAGPSNTIPARPAALAFLATISPTAAYT